MEENMVMEPENIIKTEETAPEEGVYIHKLSRPLEVFGKEYKEIRLNFAGLTGDDCLSIDRELSNEGEMVYLRVVHPVFLLKVCVKASGIGEDILRMLPIMDYVAITDRAKRFFMNAA